MFREENPMSHERKVITYQEFSNHLAEVFESVLQGEEVVVQRAGGESVKLSAAESTDGEALPPEKLAAFLSAAGGWADMDTETLKAQLRASRDMPPRPAVDL
jgi:antitoxin (DNA-binding transcriptional repressor) of toxin-antitoxin stability system